MYTVSKDGALFEWQYLPKPTATDEDEPEENSERWRIAEKHYFMQNNAHVTCAAFHAETNLLVVGFSNGIFGIHELPEFSTIQNLRYGSWSHVSIFLLIPPVYRKTILIMSR